MRLKAPRWLLLLEAALLLGATLALAYKAAMRVLPLGGMEQKPYGQKVDPKTKILEYYRQYPERYIRISKESWQLDQYSRTASHSFTLTNSATVAYQAIEVRFSYESSSGKSLQVITVKIPGVLDALGKMNVTKVKVRNVPIASERVVAAIAKALVY